MAKDQPFSLFIQDLEKIFEISVLNCSHWKYDEEEVA